ncbi:hypothetical protein I312_104771 [Cryptococcus bacillisporus CA1280]|uniref:uncharacterized protein n=1 Tax=Cryptococcus bacillisporus CA1280 TaxID=1296109 RepID=UPI0033692E38
MMHDPNAVVRFLRGRMSAGRAFVAQTTSSKRAPLFPRLLPGHSKSSPAPFASEYHPIARRPYGLPPPMPTFERYKESVMAHHSRAAFYIRVS